MNVLLVETVSALRDFLAEYRREQRSIGLVPTMGALHRGHGSLIDRARSKADVVVVSIFVNPLQFGATEDLARYPRQLREDLRFCEERRADVVFAPSEAEVYPDPAAVDPVAVGPEAEHLCGAFRPGHFQGVATVVLRLFEIVEPAQAFFGEKDIQQLAVVRHLVARRKLPIEIVALPTQRERDGLAISSRNRYLNAEERRVATVLYRALRVARQRILDGDWDPIVVREAAMTVLGLAPLARVEYFEIVDPEGMQPVERIQGPVRAAAAIWIGRTRLIDNVLCAPRSRPRRRRAKKRPSGVGAE